MILAALLATIGASQPAPLEIVLRGPAPACVVAIDGRIVTREELEAAVRRAVPQQPRVIVHTADVPPDYRCIGGIVYTIQAASPAGIAVKVELAPPASRFAP